MNNNKIVVSFTFIILFLMILVPAINKVINDKKDNSILVLKNKIILKAKLCWNENKCTNNKIYLKELYNLGYLKDLVNPITKENLKDISYIEKNGEKIIVTIVD